jgi:hypothetical protein
VSRRATSRDIVAGNKVNLLVIGHRRIHVSGHEAEPVADAPRRVEGHVLVRTEPDLGSLRFRIAVIRAERLEAGICH